MKIAFINDEHWGVRNDSDDFYNHQMKFYNNVFYPYLEEHCIKTLVNLGDLSDRRKYVNFKTLNRMRTDRIHRVKNMGIVQHNIVGNHDAFYKNTNEINAIDQLFSDIDPEMFKIYYKPEEVEFDGLKVLMMPWITADNYPECVDAIKATDAKVLFGHLELKGFEMYRGSVMHEGYDWKLFTKFDEVYTGHYHHKSSNYNIHYLGAPCEFTWADYADDRGFHVYDTDTHELTYIKNPYRMFHKVFYDDSQIDTKDKKIKFIESVKKSCGDYNRCYLKVFVDKKNDPVLFDEMIDALYKGDPIDIDIVEIPKELEELSGGAEVNLSEDTLSILKTAVDDLSVAEEQKKSVGKILTSLYNEALREVHTDDS